MIGLLIRETILLERVRKCEHDWQRLNAHEEQCLKCTVIVTAEGKKHLDRPRLP